MFSGTASVRRCSYRRKNVASEDEESWLIAFQWRGCIKHLFFCPVINMGSTGMWKYVGVQVININTHFEIRIKTCLLDSFTAKIASVFDKITICFPLSESFQIVNYYTSKWVKDIRSHRMTNPMTIC